MKRISLKQLLVGGLVVTVAVYSLFGVSTLPQYKTTTISTGTVRKEIDFTTNWYPTGYSKVSLGTSADISKVYVKEGDKVTNGRVLAQLNDEVEYNQFKATQASYYAAIKAKKNAAAIPMTPQSTLDSLQGQINTAYYQVKNSEVNLNKKKIKSPITGRVITVQLTDFSGASSSNPLTATGTTGNYIVIVNDTVPAFTASVSERDVAKLTTGMKVVLTARTSDLSLEGKVTKISKTPITVGVEDPTYQITMTLDKYPATPYGTKLEGSVVTIDKANVSVIQYDAITIDSSTEGTVLTLKDGKVSTVTVGIGAVGDDVVEVTGGISGTDQIVIDQLADKKIIGLRPWIKNLLGLN